MGFGDAGGFGDCEDPIWLTFEPVKVDRRGFGDAAGFGDAGGFDYAPRRRRTDPRG